MLFLLNGVKKLKDTGRMAIIQNGSSLFTGDAGSGQSKIRQYLIENDWLDAIVQLPNNSFTTPVLRPMFGLSPKTSRRSTLAKCS